MRCRLFSFKLKTTNRHIMQRMEREIAQTDEALIQLRAKEEALEESIRKVILKLLYTSRSAATFQHFNTLRNVKTSSPVLFSSMLNLTN